MLDYNNTLCFIITEVIFCINADDIEKNKIRAERLKYNLEKQGAGRENVVINAARKYIYIQTPYLLPTESILVALKTVALAGVDVRIMIPERSDSRLVHWGTKSYMQELMEAGVKIYWYQKGFLHSKLVVSDDRIATVGSTNMDFRSFEHNFEVNAFLYDRASVLKLKEMFLSDQKDARLVQLKTWRLRPWSQKVKESVIRLLAPLL